MDKKIQNEEIVVFAFKKGTQINSPNSNSESYSFVNTSIDIMTKGYNVTANKIGISGYREDVIGYIASLIDFYMSICKAEIVKVEDFNQKDFDPDIEASDYEK